MPLSLLTPGSRRAYHCYHRNHELFCTDHGDVGTIRDAHCASGILFALQLIDVKLKDPWTFCVHRSRVQTLHLAHGLRSNVKLGKLQKQIKLTESSADGEKEEVCYDVLKSSFYERLVNRMIRY